MSISLFFILSPRGDTIISKDYRNDTPPDAAEAFFRKVKFWDKGDAPPVFAIDGVNFIYIRINGLLIACTTRFNLSPALIIELLNRTAKVFKDYCGVLSEESIRKNFILVYELLDEILDYGYPQHTSTEALRAFVQNEAVPVEASVAALAKDTLVASASRGTKATARAAQKPIALSGRPGAGRQKNEIFVDIVERVTVLFGPGGGTIHASVDGHIQMKSYLAGNPELKLALNDDLVVGSAQPHPAGGGGGRGASGGGGGGGLGHQRGAACVIDDCNFHECAMLADFETGRTLSFIPPDGEFVLLNYRATHNDLRPPFRIFPVLEDAAYPPSGPSSASASSSLYRLDVTLRLRCCAPEAYHAANVALRVPLPRTTQNVAFDLGGGGGGGVGGGGGGGGGGSESGQWGEFLQGPQESGKGGDGSGGGGGGGGSGKVAVWHIKKFPGNSELSARLRLTLSAPCTTSVRREVGPLSLAFEMPMYNVSGLQVKYLRIADQGKAYNPYRWVRYVTQSNSYVCRI